MNEIKENTGNVKISDDVIATIANIAMYEIEGVCKKVTNPESKNILGKRAIAKGVKVTTIDNKTISVDIDVSILYGSKITEVAWHIQDNVKEHIESMTGLNVDKINVHVVNVELEKNDTKKDGAESEKEKNDVAPDYIE